MILGQLDGYEQSGAGQSLTLVKDKVIGKPIYRYSESQNSNKRDSLR